MRDKREETPRTHVPSDVHSTVIGLFLQTLDAECPKERYQASMLLSKYVGPDTDPPELRRSRAIEKWLTTERRNRATNVRLYSGEADFGYASSEDIIDFARRVIAKVLGQDVPRLYGSFSGGASTSVRRQPGAIARKFIGQADVTVEAWPYVLPMLLETYGWTQLQPEILSPRFVEGNVMFTVPKSTDIDRCACKEPDLNLFFQKGVGDYIRNRLRRVGIDLNDQSCNRNLARVGSIDGSLATLDLSSASDSISTSIVARLLPPSWFDLLNALRSKRTVIDKVVHENEMFSSMGNGFTFELETLIFYSLARAVAYFSRMKGKISVYGDDIIVPVGIAARLARVFHFFGFLVNPKKSHWRGPFRESCGGHYYRGADITPIYVKRPIDSVTRLIQFLNQLRRWSSLEFGDMCDPRFLPVWEAGARYVDRRLWGGSDCASIYQLVSPHKGRLKLEPVRNRLKSLERELEAGLYVHRLAGGFPFPSLHCYQRGQDVHTNIHLPWHVLPREFSREVRSSVAEAVPMTIVRESATVFVFRRASSLRSCGPTWFSGGHLR